jgi:hypothetical protein
LSGHDDTLALLFQAGEEDRTTEFTLNNAGFNENLNQYLRCLYKGAKPTNPQLLSGPAILVTAARWYQDWASTL